MRPEALRHSRLLDLAGLPEGWRASLGLLAAGWLSLILVFLSDWQKMFDQWWNISTYNHVLLVPVILGWLVWQRWPLVRMLVPSPSLAGLAALALAVLVWVLGAVSGFDLLRQGGAVAMLPAAALLLLGPRVIAALFFPVCYMAFMVPFGDELVTPLQTITARLTILMVQASQIPAAINGVFIDTPAGLFKVAEACSGVKFLIAMVALGVLVGNICFKSWPRRIGFFALCIVVPILANGVRAWGTVYAAQFVGAEKAAGIDHLIYGWIFFALVIAAVMGLAWRFFDRALDDPMIDLDSIGHNALVRALERYQLAPAAGAALAAVLVLIGLAWAGAARGLEANLPRQVALPEVAGWHRASYLPQADWEPLANGADHRLLGRYEDSQGRQVDVFYALYAGQDEIREAGGFGQGALIPQSSWAWLAGGPDLDGAKSERLLSGGRTERLAATWYRTGALTTGSNIRLKLANIGDHILLQPRTTMTLILSAERRPGFEPGAEIEAFRRAIGDPGQWMDQIAQGR